MSLIEDAIDRHSAAPMYDQLRQLIIDGIARDGLQPGDPLPGEHRLCERYGISRTVVRQALAQLEHEGLVERVKGKGHVRLPPRARARVSCTHSSGCTTTSSGAAAMCTATSSATSRPSRTRRSPWPWRCRSDRR
ncbi:winged helix-turn-helix domain-containing protein [Microbacterium sp. NRRL B-14842]|uniref:GntR family transcriptional regulator n=1 Tax=Microbacterium sp. NRRL B-14842 TaxID=3162881 RepID=UPI003D2992EA